MSPSDDGFWKRKRERDEKDDREAKEAIARKRRNLGAPDRTSDSDHDDHEPTSADEAAKRFQEILQRAPILMDQLENLYRQYAVGVLVRPPIEARQRLDQLIVAAQNFPKPTPADRFRYGAVISSYNSHKDRWEKLLKDIESGKIQRITGPNRNG